MKVLHKANYMNFLFLDNIKWPNLHVHRAIK